MKTDSKYTTTESSANRLTPIPLDGKIELSRAEAGHLRILTMEAENLSNRLGEAFFRRVVDQADPGDTGRLEDARRSIQRWFVHLFEQAGEEGTPETGPEFEPEASISVRYVLWMMDLILYYGEEVAAQAIKADETRRAFHKRLAQALDQLRWTEARHEMFLTEMMLLD